jgi:hypothetical protein
MSDLNPLGSEKLQADQKLKRILELAYYNNNKKTSSNKAELVSESKTGGVYGIVKEKDGYYVKRGLNESSLDYIGGMFMKNKNKFSSYAEAAKRLSLIQGQDELNEATKYVLKQNKPAENEAPAAEPTMDAAPAPAPASEPSAATEPTPDMGGDTTIPDMGGDEPTPDMGGDEGQGGESKRSDYMEEIQKFAGKLGQELRDQHQKLESDDIKYVLNMIISAVDLDKLSDEDLEDIGKKFEREEEQGGEEMPASEPAPEETPAEEPTPEQGNSELGEGMDALEYFVETGAPSQEDEDVSLSNYMDQTESLDGNHDDMGEAKSEEDEIKEIDLDAIKNAIGETLSKYFK